MRTANQFERNETDVELTCKACGKRESVPMYFYENENDASLVGWRLVSRDPETWECDDH